jgi:hypothetical protein
MFRFFLIILFLYAPALLKFNNKRSQKSLFCHSGPAKRDGIQKRLDSGSPARGPGQALAGITGVFVGKKSFETNSSKIYFI